MQRPRPCMRRLHPRGAGAAPPPACRAQAVNPTQPATKPASQPLRPPPIPKVLHRTAHPLKVLHRTLHRTCIRCTTVALMGRCTVLWNSGASQACFSASLALGRLVWSWGAQEGEGVSLSLSSLGLTAFRRQTSPAASPPGRGQANV